MCFLTCPGIDTNDLKSDTLVVARTNAPSINSGLEILQLKHVAREQLDFTDEKKNDERCYLDGIYHGLKCVISAETDPSRSLLRRFSCRLIHNKCDLLLGMVLRL